MSAARLDLAPALLEDYIQREELVGAVLLVVRDGRVVLHTAHGARDREAALPMERDTIFRIASQTKAIVSVAVLKLQEEGKLLIGDPLGKYLPEFQETTVAVADGAGEPLIVPANRAITVRDLLTHSAGIGYGYGPAAAAWADAGIQGWYFAHREEPIRETVRRMAALPMDAQPGDAFVYGYATDILGALIEVVSGESLDAYLKQALFDPIGMTDTHFYLPTAKRARLAVVYSAGKEGGAPQRAPEVSAMVGQGAYVEGPRVSFSGGAGLLSTAMDYARFLRMLQNGGRIDGVQILSPRTVALMTVDHLGDIPFRPGEGFGLGVSTTLDLGARGIPGSVGEYGWGGAYHTVYWVDPAERIIVVYMTQLLPAEGIDETRKLRAIIYGAIR
ncbi:MAG: serine hydrolase domain-containing protein [Pseudomonadales bacterium]|nr:beta-lactamase family protein [Pseudomonadales bacterium]